MCLDSCLLHLLGAYQLCQPPNPPLSVPHTTCPLARPQARLETALLEARVRKMLELLSGPLAETRARIEKRQAQTYEELKAEHEEAALVRLVSRLHS